MTDPLFVIRVLRTFYAIDDRDELLWSIKDNEVSFSAECSDAFWWGCADAEDITPENIGRLEVAIADAQAATGTTGWGTPSEAVLLFVARERKLRPQGAMYEHIDAKLWPLFDAAGPERVTGPEDPGNTARPSTP
jgi:hypothetical protein